MAIFSSRPPFNDDPAPYRYNNNRSIRRGLADMPVSKVHYTHDPRPEFDRPQNNPTNPILAEFREYSDKHGMDADDRRNLARAWLQAPRYYEGRLVAGRVLKAPRDHARRVLSRLARFKEESA